MTSTAEAAAAADSIGGPNPIVGIRRKDVTGSVGSLLAEVARHPRHAGAALGRLASAGAGVLRGNSTVRPDAKDRRFLDEAWSQNLLYRRLVQLYLMTGAEVDAWLDGTTLTAVDRARARFVLSLLRDAAAPSNLPLNPAAVKRFIDTGGTSAVTGFRQFAADLRGNGGLPSQVDKAGFEVGGNLATTPGAVVYRDEILELIQYTPRTPEVHERPLVILPPQINKFYVFDLAPDKSLVAYALDHGQQVFVVSWRNPTAGHRYWDLGTYMRAAESALEAVSSITGSADANLVGACSGGITSVALAAYLAARGKRLINTLTLFVSVFDTAEDHTLLGIFASEETMAAAKRHSRSRGVLEGDELGRMFALLRPNDLIWSYWVNNYLLGRRPPAFDVLFWNNDSTRLPAALHGQLIDIYRDNSLVAPGGVVVDGTPLDLDQVGCDAFVLAGTTDHITPWDACYRSTLRLRGDVQFLLSSSGHIQSILNPPGNPKSAFFRNPERPATAKEWRAGAEQVAGSWWPHWLDWLASRSGAQKAATRRLGNRTYAPLDPAPGSYVHE
jgi:polyhydroxyalkanoate synthase subunit PhaC